MSRPSNPYPNDDLPGDPTAEGRLLDHLAGELAPDEAKNLAADLASDANLANAMDSWSRLRDLEREAFEPASGQAALSSEATRVAAWVRSTARAEAAVPQAEAAFPQAEAALRAAPVRGWARILGYSLAAHALALVVLGIVWQGRRVDDASNETARVGMQALDDFDVVDYDPADAFAGVQWRSILSSDLGANEDQAALMEQERLTEELPNFEFDEPAGWGPPEHPSAVIVPMTRRRHANLKRRRLDLLGFNSQGTLKAVARGLGVLANRQNAASGMFQAVGSPATVRTTALAALAFLGEGYSSHGRSAHDAVVRRAIVGLRKAEPQGADIGPLVVALCEDYMLSYGSLTPNASASRSTEIAALASDARRLLSTPEAASAADRTWLLWALDATQRAGIVQASQPERARFDGWVASAADPAAGGAANAQAALTVGTALLYAERGSSKPRFKSWSRANGAALLARLKATGEARGGDPIGDTALILLALQVSYRTY